MVNTVMVSLALLENGVSVSRLFNCLTFFLDDHLSNTLGATSNVYNPSDSVQISLTSPQYAIFIEYFGKLVTVEVLSTK